MASVALQLWNRYVTTAENNRQFVDALLLDEICGTTLRNKTRLLEVNITEMMQGIEPKIEMTTLIRKIHKRNQRVPSLCVAARIMQLIILRGFKDMPWNETRRNLVEEFFSQHLIPDVDPFTAR